MLIYTKSYMEFTISYIVPKFTILGDRKFNAKNHFLRTRMYEFWAEMKVVEN